MDKMNLLSINFRNELVKAVDPRFLRSPVVAVLPILGKFLDLFDVGAVFPCRAWNLIGPSGVSQTTSKIHENVVGNMCSERANCGSRRLWWHLRLSKRS